VFSSARKKKKKNKNKKVITNEFLEMTDVKVQKICCVWRKQEYEQLG